MPRNAVLVFFFRLVSTATPLTFLTIARTGFTFSALPLFSSRTLEPKRAGEAERGTELHEDEGRRNMEASAGGVRHLLHLRKPVRLGTEPWKPASNECGRPGGNRCAAGRSFPELHQLDWQRHRSNRGRRRCGRCSCLLAARPRCWPMARGSGWTVGCFRGNPVDRVLDHQWNRRRDVNRGGTRL